MGTMLFNHLWQTTLFACAAGLVALLLRPYAASYRFGVWMAASLKFLAPFAVLAALGGHMAWRPEAPVAAPVALRAMAQPFVATDTGIAPTGAVASFTPPVPRRRNRDMGWLVGLWLCGFLAVTGTWLRRWRRVSAAVRLTRAPEGPLAGLPVRVRLTDSAALEPGVFGIARPVLLLPANLAERLGAEQLDAVLAHEICHVQRRDNLWAALHMLVEAVFWFHPMVWWIGGRLVAERERACDEAVLANGNEPERYAEGILEVCRHYVDSPLACVAGVTGADLKRRLAAIMAHAPGRSLTGGGKAALLALGLAVIAVPLATGMVFHSAAPPAAWRSAMASQAGTAPRHIVFFFDLTTIPPKDVPNLVSYVAGWVKYDMRPDDQVRITGLVLQRPLTEADRATLPIPLARPLRGSVILAGDVANTNFTSSKDVLMWGVYRTQSVLPGNAVPSESLDDVAKMCRAQRLRVPGASEKTSRLFIAEGDNRAAMQTASEACADAATTIYPINARALAEIPEPPPPVVPGASVTTEVFGAMCRDCPPLAFPEFLARGGYQGKVVVSVTLAADGSVAALRAGGNAGMDLRSTAERAVANWKFEAPGATPATATVDVNFALGHGQ